jgi:hypothetical protein
MTDVIGKLLKDNNMPDTPTARAIYKKMLEPDDEAPLTLNGVALYTRREWAGLTDEDWAAVGDMPDTFDQGVAWAAARLKERNT